MKAPLSGLLLLEATLCGFPATFLALVYLPWAAIASVSEFSASPLFASAVAALALAITFALSQYWYLAVQTCTGRTYTFGKSYIVGVVCAVVTLIALLALTPPMASATIPTIVGTIHFAKLQRRRTRPHHNSAAARIDAQ